MTNNEEISKPSFRITDFIVAHEVYSLSDDMPVGFVCLEPCKLSDEEVETLRQKWEQAWRSFVSE